MLSVKNYIHRLYNKDCIDTADLLINDTLSRVQIKRSPTYKQSGDITFNGNSSEYLDDIKNVYCNGLVNVKILEENYNYKKLDENILVKVFVKTWQKRKINDKFLNHVKSKDSNLYANIKDLKTIESIIDDNVTFILKDQNITEIYHDYKPYYIFY